MEQRRLRLGDILDDYCPRERRVTNHAVVAMIEEDVKQTRCTTCDSEHAYKGGREPRRRKKGTPDALYREVLADMPEAIPAPSAPSAPDAEVPLPAAAAGDLVTESAEAEADDAVPIVMAAEAEAPEEEEAVEEVAPQPQEEGPVHRPLIRATLPRPEGQKDVRQVPDFTIRQNTGRGGHFRGDRSQRAGANGNGNGNRPHGRRFSGGQPAAPGRGSSGRGGGGFRGGQGQQRQGGRKRPR